MTSSRSRTPRSASAARKPASALTATSDSAYSSPVIAAWTPGTCSQETSAPAPRSTTASQVRPSASTTSAASRGGARSACSPRGQLGLVGIAQLHAHEAHGAGEVSRAARRRRPRARARARRADRAGARRLMVRDCPRAGPAARSAAARARTRASRCRCTRRACASRRPVAQPRQSAGMPAASAAFASVEAATSSSGRPSSSRTRRTVASSGWRRSSRPAGRRPTSSTSSVSGGSTVSTCSARPKRASSVSSSARCSITSSAWAAIALTAVPPWIRPMFVLASPRGCRLSVRAMRQTSSIALGRPRLAQEWPPGPRTVIRARRLPTRVDGDVREAVALERERQVGLQGRARRARTREVAEALLADGERDGDTLGLAVPRELLHDLHGAHDRCGVVADPGPADAVALDLRLVRDVPREDRVHVREQEHPRPGAVEAPRSGCRRCRRPCGRARRRAAAGARRCARPRRRSERARAPVRSGRQGHRPRRSRRADAIRPRGVPTGRRPSGRGTRPRPRSPHRR